MERESADVAGNVEFSGTTLAIRAKSIITMAGEVPARGARLFEPLKKIDNGVLLVRDGLVIDVLPWGKASLPPDTHVRDLGPICLAPACINAHLHLELSHLAGKTCWGKGFTAWLASLIPLLGSPPDAECVADACADMLHTGTLYAGNVAGSLAGGMALVDAASRETGLIVRHFCEWFGFGVPFVDAQRPWPPRCRAYVTAHAATAAYSAPAGHALYSTGPDVLAAAHADCRRMGGVFSIHLAESPEETELLASGGGPLRQLYDTIVLPGDWSPPGLRPLTYAMKLGLLSPGTLAVHGVQLNAQEIDVLAASGAALCLCPRSNYNLGVGLPLLRVMMESGCLLCLGTDGLTSNRNLDVRQEAIWLRETFDVPPEALIRFLTVNGAAALNLTGRGAGRLEPGGPAHFCVIPEELTC